MSIDETRPASYHFAVGQKLAALRNDNVLVLGSGNLVHNLEAYAWGRHMPEAYEWATRFEDSVKALLLSEKTDLVDRYENLGAEAALCVPTPEHFLPLLYVLGVCQPDDSISFPIEGVDGGSISMLAVRIG